MTSRPNKGNRFAERGDWRKQSIVKATLSFVEDDIQHVLAQSPFLLKSEPGVHIALFHRSEIRTGSRLGKGGFSYVYEIVGFELNPQYSDLLTPSQQELREYYRNQARTGEGRYAIKYLQERLLHDRKAFQCAASDLAIEAAYMSALDHPNILSVRGLPIHGLESFSEGRHDSYFIILDQLETTLDRKISHWRHGHDMAVLGKAGHALELAAALDYLHQRGILFRDLKPQNIGFTTDGKLQLLDFGLCRELPPSSYSVPDEVFEMSGVGTRRYMAVEIVNTSMYNDKADVYSWAMVFWEMLSMERPYSTHSVEDHKRLVCQGGERPLLRKHWPQAIQNLLQHSWTTSIPDRLSMKEVECLLRTFIECCRVLDDDIPESPTAVIHGSTLLLYDDAEGLALQPLGLPFPDDIQGHDDDNYYHHYHYHQSDGMRDSDAPHLLYSDVPDVRYRIEESNVRYMVDDEATLLKDHPMTNLQDMSQISTPTSDLLSLQSSMFGSVTAATTDVSSVF